MGCKMQDKDREDIEDQKDRGLARRVNKAKQKYKLTGGISLRSVVPKGR